MLELKAIDKDLVMKKINEVSNFELSTSLNLHTLGITLATFDEDMGPTPLFTTPKSLEKGSSFLYKINFRSFSNCEFAPDLNVLNQAIYNYTHSEKGVMKVLSHSFALDRPHYRGGQENITLSILIYPTFYTILSPFLDTIMKRIKTIHNLLNSNPEDKRVIMLEMIELRELISKIILAYLTYH